MIPVDPPYPHLDTGASAGPQLMEEERRRKPRRKKESNIVKSRSNENENILGILNKTGTMDCKGVFLRFLHKIFSDNKNQSKSIKIRVGCWI